MSSRADVAGVHDPVRQAPRRRQKIHGGANEIMKLPIACSL
jgi:hypothetical protein